MKKILSVILCTAMALILAACQNEQKRQSKTASYMKEYHEKEQSRYRESWAAEISEVDEWGISLDDVERLAKDTIRKHEMQSEYKSDYNKIVKEIDTFLSDIKSGKAVEYNVDHLLKKHSEACQAGIEYIKSSYDIKLTYDLYMTDNQLDKFERDVLRDILTTWNRSINKIEQSQTDMKSLLDPIILENRKLTDEEIQKADEIYHVLTDIILKVD